MTVINNRRAILILGVQLIAFYKRALAWTLHRQEPWMTSSSLSSPSCLLFQCFRFTLQFESTDEAGLRLRPGLETELGPTLEAALETIEQAKELINHDYEAILTTIDVHKNVEA